MSYFKDEEFKCKCGCGLNNHSPTLHQLCDKIRAKAGKPITISSGCRCMWNNGQCKGKWNGRTPLEKGKPGKPGDGNSCHTHGTAADIQCKSIGADALHALILAMYTRGELPELAGLGQYNTFCHIDIEPKSSRLRRWDERTKKA